MKSAETVCHCGEESDVDITESNTLCTANSNGGSTACFTCARCRTNGNIYYIVSLACISSVILFLCVVALRYQTYMCMSNFDQFDAKLRNLQFQLSLLQRQNRKERRQRSLYTVMKSNKLISKQLKPSDTFEEASYVTTKKEEDTEHTYVGETNDAEIWKIPRDQTSLRSKRSIRHNKLNKLKKKCRRKKGQIFLNIEGRKGRESLPDGKFHKWQVSHWAHETTLTDDFKLNYNGGTVRVRKGGIYIIYAQITMIGEPNQGFYIIRYKKNVRPSNSAAHDKLALCMQNYVHTNHSVEEGSDHSKLLTCSTMGIFHLFDNDTIYLQHTSKAKSMASFHSNASFFGLVQLGDNKYMKLLKDCKNLNLKRH